MQRQPSVPQQPPPRRATAVRSGPLTWIQQWHWYEHTIPPQRRVNPTPLADHCRVPPSATIADIHAALTTLTERHEALRTTVDALRPVQHVHGADWAPLPLDRVDVPTVDTAALDAATAALAALPIDPVCQPPWRARVLLESGKPRAVLVTVHHVVIDGWGLAVLIDQLYERLCGADVPPESLPHPLDMLAAQSLERARAAEREWLARLGDNPAHVLAPFGGTEDGAGRHRLQYRSADAHDALDRVAAHCRVSPETVVLAALAHDVAARTGEHRFLASVVVSNRARAVWRDSIGVRALTVPVQIDLLPGVPFAEAVASVAAALSAAYRHGQWRPAELVAAQACLDRRRGAVTVPTIEYNCYSWPRDYLVPAYGTAPDGPVAWIDSAPDAPCDTLYVDVSRDAGVLTLDVTVGDHLLDAEEAISLPVRLCGLLRAVADGAHRPVPAQALAPPAPGWWRTPQGWASLPRIADVLREHPGVLDVTVTPSAGVTTQPSETTESGGPHLVVRARVAPGVTADVLHHHLLDHLDEVHGLVAPDRYVLTPTGAALLIPSTTDALPPRPPATRAEQALAVAVAASAPTEPDPLDGPAAVDMNRCLADHGITLVTVPRLLVLLRQFGFTAIASDELAGTASLGHLAAALEPVVPCTPPGGEAAP
ncbi:hypothetical protein CP975_02580 [Streptomyces alboniger]|uniref:Condensation domain-containing protein n=1 Tax=Streptomyces alboniger TaxID=132473 RepID=A0A5J6HS89_STRAD|nr:hypothetical protein CP975_02580 [Streptomyces alboniger]